MEGKTDEKQNNSKHFGITLSNEWKNKVKFLINVYKIK